MSTATLQIHQQNLYRIEASAQALLLLYLHMTMIAERYRQQPQNAAIYNKFKNVIQVVLEYIHSARILLDGSIPQQKNKRTRRKGRRTDNAP